MALVLDATVGGASSNSYATEAEGTAYFETRLYSDTWTNASSDQRKAALVWATRLLDRMVDWNGHVVTTTQALRHPRAWLHDADDRLYAHDIIAPPVKEATIEFAKYLLESNRIAESGQDGLKRLKVGPIELDFDKLDRTETMPEEVFQLIAHLGTLKLASTSSGMRAVRLERA